jgi:ABC-type transporter Mla MlaB component
MTFPGRGGLTSQSRNPEVDVSLPPHATVWAIGPTIDRADIPILCANLVALLDVTGATVVMCDVGRIVEPDAVTVEALARLQLTARRFGRYLTICRANHRLLDLMTFVGLSDVLSVESARQAEQRTEPVGVEERADPPDPAG